MKRLLTILSLLFIASTIYSQSFTLAGKVIDRKSKTPIEFSTIVIVDKELWTVADEKGEFIMKKIPKGKIKIEVSCLSYQSAIYELDLSKDITNFVFQLSEDNLTLKDAVVTAKESSSNATTNRTIDKVAIDHLQLNNVTDVSSLLPGGATPKSSLLTSDSQFEIRSSGESLDNSSFGTAVEVDGVRLSSNSAYKSMNRISTATKGASTRNIASANIESVEIITGVPSVEYGDMTNGMVKINTRQGKTPFIVNLMTNPNTKQMAISKGFGLGKRGGIINLSAERTIAVAQLDSPYTSYQRNNISAIYTNTFGISTSMPIKFKFGVTGNIGGQNSKADPDSFKDTYSKQNDNTIRGNFSFNWLLNKSWITNIELSGSAIYSDKLYTEKVNKSSSASSVGIHGMEEGYFVATPYEVNPNAEIILRPSGYWYEQLYDDSKELDYNIHLKANWSHNFGSVTNKIKLGAIYTGSGNLGRGEYYKDMQTAPSWRPYLYSDVPFMNNIATYLEENINIPIGSTNLNMIAGIRSEWTTIKGSDYGTVNSLSPRFNGKYTILKYDRKRFVKEFSIRASWGIAVKLPSFGILFPKPRYQDKLVFSPGSLADGSSFSAYHIMPKTLEYNPNLIWQRNQQSEIGIETNLGGVKVSLTGYYNKTYNAYTTVKDYDNYTYKWTDQKDLEKCTIPSENRQYSINQTTGIVTVSDRTGVMAPQTLSYTNKNTFIEKTTTANNSSPSLRAGAEWVVDFGMIKPIMTSIRFDGSYYYYRGVASNITASSPTSLRMPDGVTPYQYIGYYVGKDGYSNGSEANQVRANLTFTTHIPKIRMIISLKVESSLYSSKQTLSEYEGGQITYPTSDKAGDYLPSGTDFYGKYNYTVTYPLYYTSFDNPDEQIPFFEKFAWAKENDIQLYNTLSHLVQKSSFNYNFRKQGISPYFTANLSVTKEIGDIASISFYANNFINTLSRVRFSQKEVYESLYGSTLIPQFYYGMTLRLKF